ncbi:cobalamin biosynthesis protein [Nocardia sp. NBC_01329]|uniref:cobalamin biosynthesis protein n=1 Tax=Nocardia sp. NBC_01329 TaxID=2903594 RepID=UPI002E147195|nr:cobalamin biosynthesis protein [Nocardia sp. NBC_01329]
MTRDDGGFGIGPAPLVPAYSGLLAVGLGLRPDLSADRVLVALAEALPGRRIGCLATLDRRAREPGLLAAAAELGVPLLGYSVVRMAQVPVPTPSERVVAALGIPGVAEAAALLAGTGPLLVPRQVVGGVVVAATAARG